MKISRAILLSAWLSVGLVPLHADHTAQGISREISSMFNQFGSSAGADLLLLAEYADQVRELEHLESAVDGLTQAYKGKLTGFLSVTAEKPYISASAEVAAKWLPLLPKSAGIPVGEAQLEVLDEQHWALVTKVGSPEEGECLLGVIFSPRSLISNAIALDEEAACRIVFGGAGPAEVWTMDLGSEEAARMLAGVPAESGPYIDEVAFDILHAQSLRETVQFLNWDFDLSLVLVQPYRERLPGQLTGRWMGACSFNDGETEGPNNEVGRGGTMDAVVLQREDKVELKLRFDNRVSGFIGSRKGMDITAWPDGLVKGGNSGFCKASYLPAKKALKGEVYRNNGSQTEKLSFYLLPAVQ